MVYILTEFEVLKGNVQVTYEQLSQSTWVFSCK